MDTCFEIFLVAPPGLEQTLCDEARTLGFAKAQPVPGGVSFEGNWPDVWRANRYLRGATRVLARIGSFRAFHLAQLDKRSRKFPWAEVLRPDVSVRVEVTCKKSKIYHAGAAKQRIEKAIAETLGAEVSDKGTVQIKARIDDNLVTFSVDTSGESLHKRGHKEAVGKAPMRETLAALFLRAAGYDGKEPVLDPMCGSGTFVIEAAEQAMGLAAGRARHFAFEQLATFDASQYSRVKAEVLTPSENLGDLTFFGSDRNDGAIANSTANADRAAVAVLTQFTKAAVSDLQRPDGPPGLVIVNPPYGTRIGNKKLLFALHGALGEVLKERFSGWRVGIVTSDAALAKSTGLPFKQPGPPVPHGGLKVKLYQTAPLP